MQPLFARTFLRSRVVGRWCLIPWGRHFGSPFGKLGGKTIERVIAVMRTRWQKRGSLGSAKHDL
jgi:hypothetical protein